MPPSNLPPGVHDVPPARAVLLSGEHPTLPAAELRALLDVHDPRAGVHAQGLVAVVQPGRPEGTDAALARMALAHEWGELWAQAPETAIGLEQLAAVVRQRATGRGSAAVATERRGEGKGLDRGVSVDDPGNVLTEQSRGK